MELIAVAIGSPFNGEIHEMRLPEGFKLLTIKAYGGSLICKTTFDHFNNLMELYLVSKLVKCRVFTVTLIRGAKKLLMSIPAGSISSRQQLSTSFLQHFWATKKSVVPLAYLGNVKQKKGETLKSYINHFNDVSNFLIWSPDVGVLSHLTNGVLPETPL